MSNTPFKLIFKLAIVSSVVFSIVPFVSANPLKLPDSALSEKSRQVKSLEYRLERLLLNRSYRACNSLIETAKSKFPTSEYCYWRARLYLAEAVSEAKAAEEAALKATGCSFTCPPIYQREADLPDNLKRALFQVNRSILSRPGQSKYYALRSEIYDAAEMNVAAITDITRAIDLCPLNARSYYLRAFYWYSSAGRITSSDLNKCPIPTLKSKFAAIGRLMDSRDGHTLAVKEALKDLNESIVLDGKSARSYSLRAKVRDALGQPLALSIADCNKAIELEPKNPELWSQRSFCRIDVRAAESDMAQALRLDPTSSDNMLVHAQQLCDLGRFAECKVAFEVLDRQRSDAFYLKLRGNSFYAMGSVKGAIDSWLRTNDSIDITKAAYASCVLGDRARALRLCDRALAGKYGFFLQAHWLKAQLLEKDGLRVEAMKEGEYIQKAIKAQPLLIREFRLEPQFLPQVAVEDIDSFCQHLRSKPSGNYILDFNKYLTMAASAQQ